MPWILVLIAMPLKAMCNFWNGLNLGIEAICILGETRGPNPDPRSAIRVVEALNNIYDFDVPIEPMKEQAEQIEQMMHKLSEQVGEAEAKPSKEGMQQMYG